MIVINADDWGRSRVDTDATMSCFREQRLASTSAMVFMADSARAASLALEHGLDVGLHLNFSEMYTSPRADSLVSAHTLIVRFITGSKYAFLFYHPWLRKEFRSVYDSQVSEFIRLYGKPPSHIDGHQHMHLCGNMVFDKIIPAGMKVRRHFTFWPGEKGLLNRSYRRWIDGMLAQRYRMTNFFFSLEQILQNGSFERISALAISADVEVMTHARMPAEYSYLASPQCLEFLRGTKKISSP